MTILEHIARALCLPKTALLRYRTNQLACRLHRAIERHEHRALLRLVATSDVGRLQQHFALGHSPTRDAVIGPDGVGRSILAWALQESRPVVVLACFGAGARLSDLDSVQQLRLLDIAIHAANDELFKHLLHELGVPALTTAVDQVAIRMHSFDVAAGVVARRRAILNAFTARVAVSKASLQLSPL